MADWAPLFIGATASEPALVVPGGPSIPTTWAPSTWRPGMPTTSPFEDRSKWPMPTQAQIDEQRALIEGRYRARYGNSGPHIDQGTVVASMTNLPQGPIDASWPDWARDWARRNPSYAATYGARAGFDVPYTTSYEPYNLAHQGSFTKSGGMNDYSIPRGALAEHYGQAYVDELDRKEQARRQADADLSTQLFQRRYLELQARERAGIPPDFFGIGPDGRARATGAPPGFMDQWRRDHPQAGQQGAQADPYGQMQPGQGQQAAQAEMPSFALPPATPLAPVQMQTYEQQPFVQAPQYAQQAPYQSPNQRRFG